MSFFYVVSDPSNSLPSDDLSSILLAFGLVGIASGATILTSGQHNLCLFAFNTGLHGLSIWIQFIMGWALMNNTIPLMRHELYELKLMKANSMEWDQRMDIMNDMGSYNGSKLEPPVGDESAIPPLFLFGEHFPHYY